MPLLFSMLRRAVLKRYYAFKGIPTYNITYSKAYAYVWFQVPKNGTRTLLSVLEEKTMPNASAHYLPYYAHRHRTDFKFCFMRNPWDRLVSCYKDKVLGQLLFPDCWGRDFDYFLCYVAQQDLRRCDPHIRLQVSLFPLEDMDHIARFENFAGEFDFIINEQLGLNSRILHINKSKQEGAYTSYYNDRQRQLVAKLYKEDIDLMGYSYGGSAEY